MENKEPNYSEQTINKYKQLIFKLMMILLDKYGSMVVDWMGFVLGLNKNGKTISEQSVDEIAGSLRELNDKLRDPKIQQELLLMIKESEPILKEGLITMLRVGTAGMNYVIKDFITLVCNESPAAPICGIFKLIGNTIEFGNELLEGSNDSIKLYDDAKKWVDSLQKKMEVINENAEKFKSMGDEYTNRMQQYGDQVTNYSKEMSNKYNDLAQKKLDRYGLLVPDSQKYKKSLNDLNQNFQSSADLANQKLKSTTSDLNKYAQDTTDQFSNKINTYSNRLNQKGGTIKKLNKKGLQNNNLRTRNIKKRTRRSIDKFKNL